MVQRTCAAVLLMQLCQHAAFISKKEMLTVLSRALMRLHLNKAIQFHEEMVKYFSLMRTLVTRKQKECFAPGNFLVWKHSYIY